MSDAPLFRLAPDDPVFVAGHRGLVGSAVVRALRARGHHNLLLRTRRELDLTRQEEVARFLAESRPRLVIDCAARVGGIHANDTRPADFIRDNLLIQNAVIDGAWRAEVEKLVFLGSSCIYPREAPQPMREEHLLTGPLEPTNQWYAVAKIAGIKMCQAYRRQYGFDAISLMPTNLYGPGDNFSLTTSHVLPALLRKFVEAKESDAPEVEVWGSGRQLREFLHVDDLADALLFLVEHYSDEQIVNVGTGEEVSIAELAETVRRATGYGGRIRFDTSRPEGAPRKLLDVSRLKALGWSPSIPLERGIHDTLEWFLAHRREARTE